jgi:anti-anti-sigma factor
MAHSSVSGEDAFDSPAYASFDLDHVHGCAVVVATGEIDLCTSPGLREALSSAAESADRIIIDLTGVTMLDSTGIGVLMRALRRNHHRQDGTLCLVGPAGSVRKVLDITHVSRLFPIYRSVEEAVAELA